MRTMSMLIALLLASAASANNFGPVNPEALDATVKELASDAFEGRGPGTPGEERTIAYLIDRLKEAGLQPAGDKGGWTQVVPLVRTKVEGGTLSATAGGKAMPLVQGRDVYVSTIRGVDRIRIQNAPMVFVGYGVNAPERQWDDFKGVDLRGKVVVFLVNDPDFSATPDEPVAGKFGGRRMTYYGRWTYKYEEAARRGALAALIVHDEAGAGYGWSTVTAPGGTNYGIPQEREPVLLQGWISGDAAKAIFRASGLDLDALRIAARRSDFRPVELTGETLSTDLTVKHDIVQSHNILAKIAGTTHSDEAVMFGAHWDAYGVGAPDAAGRTIRAGAADDAIGVAGVIELARAFKSGPPPQRTLLFGLWTAEERGLLGSEYYGEHPTFPLSRTVANLTMDVLQTAGPARDVVLVGDGQSELDDMLASAARKQGRTVTPEGLPERGLYFRADHFSVARRGVPALLMMGMSGGSDLAQGGRAAGEAWLTDYMKCYHQTCDTWSPRWDLRGAAQDVNLLYAIGSELANSRSWPQWRQESEFKAVREQSEQDRSR